MNEEAQLEVTQDILQLHSAEMKSNWAGLSKLSIQSHLLLIDSACA